MQEVCDSHHAIIRFHGTYNDLTHHFLVLEHFAATMKDFVTAELNNHIISKIKRKNKTSEKHQLRQITEGLNFLHKKNIGNFILQLGYLTYMIFMLIYISHRGSDA